MRVLHGAIAAPPLVVPRFSHVWASAVDDPFAGLIICTNSNICGKNNPTNIYGWGFAFRAIECIRVLSPPGLAVLPGPCFIRCSSGVNAKLVLPDGTPEVQRDDKKLVNRRPYWRLNSVELCVAWLEEELGDPIPRDLLRAYTSYADACVTLGDSVNGKVRGDIEYNDLTIESTQSAMEALPLLDAAAEFILASDPDGGWEPAPATMRGAFGASAWTESFYKSRLTLTAPGAEAEEAPQFDVASIAGGSAKDADAALDAVSASLKASAPRRGAAQAAPPTADTPLEGSYGKRGVAGKMRGVASRDGVLRGTWQESGARGAMRLELSADGLSFSGLAKSSSGESYEWTGNRLADPSVAAGGSARARWEARTLALRSRAHLKLGKLDDAVEGAAEACRRCPTLPCAWEAVAEAALQASDAAALRIGLKELLYLQPETAPALPIRVSNARRTQRLVLEQLERGELTLGPSKLKELNPVIPWQLSSEPERASSGGGDGDELAAELKLDAIFAESYGIDGEMDE